MTEIAKSPRISKLLILIIIAAFVLRLGPPGSIGIDHFDEGVYASAGDRLYAFGTTESFDPFVIPYGPPVTSILIAICETLLGGPSDTAAILPGIFSGTLAVYLAFRIANKLFGNEAGLIAAMLLATSGMAVAFSRSALTEAPLMAVWLLAMLAGVSFLQQPGWATALGLGSAVGLAQLTKYNGGLTGVIVAATALADLVFVPRETIRDKRMFVHRIAWGLLAILIACLIYSPWFFFVENHGGYRALMRHHGGYLNGFDRWLPQLRLQLAQSWRFQAQLPLVIAAIAGVSAVIVLRAPNKVRSALLIETVAASTAVIVLPHAIFITAIYWASKFWVKRESGLRLLSIWLLIMFVLTPFYHPYARLWLPTHLASLMIVAGILGRMALSEPDAMTSDTTTSNSKYVWYLVLVSSIIWTVPVSSLTGSNSLPSVWSGRTSLRDEITDHVEKIRAVTGRGRNVSLLLSPTGRRILRINGPSGGFGPGRIALLPELSAWRSDKGPLLVDQGTLTDSDRSELIRLLPVPRETGNPSNGINNRDQPCRGLITILDLAPGVALGEPVPEFRTLWIDP